MLRRSPDQKCGSELSMRSAAQKGVDQCCSEVLIRSVDQKRCSDMLLTSVSQKCRSGLSISSVAQKCCSDLSIRSVTQKSCSELSTRRMDQRCRSKCAQKCCSEVSIRFVARVAQKYRSKVLLRSVAQKCGSEVSLRRIDQKRGSDVLLRNVDQKSCSEASIRKKCRSEVWIRTATRRSEVSLKSVAQKCRCSEASPRRSVSQGVAEICVEMSLELSPKNRSKASLTCLCVCLLSSVA